MIVRVSGVSASGNSVIKQSYSLRNYETVIDLTRDIRNDLSLLFEDSGEEFGSWKIDELVSEFSGRNFCGVFSLSDFLRIDKLVYASNEPRIAIPEMLADGIYPYKNDSMRDICVFYDTHYLGQDSIELIESVRRINYGERATLVKEQSPADILKTLANDRFFITSGDYYFKNPQSSKLRKAS